MEKKKTRRATRAFYAGLSYLSPRWNTKLLYLRKFGRLPDLKHPQTLNEKLLKQKLERFGTDPVVRQCADKYRVRDYVAGCGCGGTLNRLLAVYDRPEDIDWDALPEDYKFYCFHGRADCVMLCVGRDEGWPKFYFFDRDFRLLRINRDSQAAPEDFTLLKPAGLDEAFAIADRLSKPFDFVRVDLYLTPRGVRFGELTFTPAAALDNKRLPETDLRFGRRMEETL